MTVVYVTKKKKKKKLQMYNNILTVIAFEMLNVLLKRVSLLWHTLLCWECSECECLILDN